MRAVALLVLFAAAAPVEAKPWYRSIRWWVGEGVIVTAAVLDARSTVAAQRIGGVERNPLLGRHPSPGVVWSATAGGIGAMTTLHWLSHKTWQSDTTRRRFMGDVGAPFADAVIEGPIIAHNMQIRRK